MAVDCLAGYLYWLRKDGETAPEASTLEQIDPIKVAASLELSGSEVFVNVGTVDVAEYVKAHFEKSVKKRSLFLHVKGAAPS